MFNSHRHKIYKKENKLFVNCKIACETNTTVDSSTMSCLLMNFQSKVPYFVNATAGTTVYGAYDPLDKIADICQKYGLWMHVDGAWGGSALLSKKYRGLMKGIDRWGTKKTTLTLDLHYIYFTFILHLHVIKKLKIILTISFLIVRNLRPDAFADCGPSR